MNSPATAPAMSKNSIVTLADDRSAISVRNGWKADVRFISSFFELKLTLRTDSVISRFIERINHDGHHPILASVLERPGHSPAGALLRERRPLGELSLDEGRNCDRRAWRACAGTSPRLVPPARAGWRQGDGGWRYC